MATPRRRSARLRQSATPEVRRETLFSTFGSCRPTNTDPCSQRSAVKKSTVSENKLGSLLERDETPETGAQAQPTLDTILSTPNGPPGITLRDRMAQLSALKTPATAPRPSNQEMHPGHAHQSTAKTPDSGMRLGFSSPDNDNKSLAEAQNTPTKAMSPPGIPDHLKSPGFEFKFASSTALSSEAQKLMDNVREEANRIKEQMRLERDEQERKDGEVEGMFINAAGRKIAQPKGRAGRFSDVHLAEFKKMDSIANHASAFRARPGYLQPTTGSLKRSGSKAELDEPERPRTAGKSLSPMKSSTTPRRKPAAFDSTSKPVVAPTTVTTITGSPPKRQRLQDIEGISADSPTPGISGPAHRPTAQARSGFGFMSNLLTPTKASLARSATMKEMNSSPAKASMLPRSASTKDLKASSPEKEHSSQAAEPSASASPSYPNLPQLPPQKGQLGKVSAIAEKSANKPLPPIPAHQQVTSKLPKFTGLKSILRRHQPLYSNDPIKIAAGTHIASPSGSSKINQHLTNLSSDGVGTPDRRMTMGMPTASPKKRVEFTPSTRSRHDLALASPSPSKIPTAAAEKRPGTPFAPPAMFDPAAYLLNDDIHYPTLNVDSSPEPSSPPVAPITQPVRQVRQQEVLSRDSPGFKSIFMTLHPRPPPPDMSKAADKTRSPSSSPFKPSPTTIRQVRESGVGVQPSVQPFEDLQTVPHGIPGKKRRRESNDDTAAEPTTMRQTSKRQSIMPAVPGGFPADSPQADGPTAKRRKLFSPKPAAQEGSTSMKENIDTGTEMTKTPTKKPNAARTAAANAAKERKHPTPGRKGGKSPGFMTMSRLNMLSRPKDRK